MGPGEYAGLVVPLFLAPDSTIALDLMRDRGSVLDRNLTVVRGFSTTWSGRVGSFMLFGRTLLVSGAISEQDAQGRPLHLFAIDSSSARRIRSFAPPASDGLAAPSPATAHWLIWKLGPGVNNTYWSADVRRYRLTQWSVGHDVIVDLVRKPGWLLDTIVATAPGRVRSSPPSMQAIAQDSSGLLWVATLIRVQNAGANVSRGPVTPPVRGAREPPSDAGGRLRYSTHLEVIDPVAARVVTSLSLAESLVSLLPGRRAAVYSEDSTGYPLLRVIQFTLSGR
jgi:hypothetical protein